MTSLSGAERGSLLRSLGTTPISGKRSRSEKAILGALGEFRGILGAALGIGNSILGIRNSILGMASHDLINTKPTILGATLGAIPAIAANPPEIFSFAPAFSERFFKNWGGPRAPKLRKGPLQWNPVLPFLVFLLWRRQGKPPTKKTRIFIPTGKEGKNALKIQGTPCRGKTRTPPPPKKKSRKRRSVNL